MLEIKDFTVLTDGSYQCEQDPGEPGYAWHSKRRSINTEETAILASLATDEIVLEIGTGLGISALTMSKVANEVTTVDIDPWVKDNVWPMIREKAWHINCMDKLPTVEQYFSLAFIDGNHLAYDVQRDVEACRELGIPKIIMHDCEVGSVQDGVRMAGGKLYQIGHTRLGIAVFE